MYFFFFKARGEEVIFGQGDCIYIRVGWIINVGMGNYVWVGEIVCGQGELYVVRGIIRGKREFYMGMGNSIWAGRIVWVGELYMGRENCVGRGIVCGQVELCG